MKTVKAWVDKWIEQFGTEKDDDDVKLIIKTENDKTVYEGHFLDTPDMLYGFEIIENGRYVASSDKSREGAYWLKVKADFDLNKLLEQVETLLKETTSPKEAFVKGSSGCGKPFGGTYAELHKKSKDELRTEAVSKAVSKRIINLCDEYGYSVNCLSKLSGITQSTVSDIVNCKSKNVGIITIKKLCEGFCITLEEFFTDTLFREYH